MRWVFSLVVAVLLLVPGCTEMKDYTAVYEKYDLEYTSSGYQMANTYEKNANNETVSMTTHVVEIDFSATHLAAISIGLRRFGWTPVMALRC